MLSITSGLLMALSWPSGGFPFLALAGLVPLFFIEDHILKHRNNYQKYAVFVYSWLAFLIFNLLTTWWILYASVAGMVVAVTLNSLFMAIPWAVMHQTRKVLPGRQGPLALIILWLAFEYLHGLWELSWSWLDLGNAFAAWPQWVQWYEYTGASGGTLWILVVNLLLFLLISQLLTPHKPLRKLFWYALLLGVAIIIPMLLSFSIGRNYHEIPDPIEVVVIQPGDDPYQRAETNQQIRQKISRMMELARDQITPDTRFVVAPEGASPTGIWAGQEEDHPMVEAIRQFQQEHPQAAWIFGSFVYKMYSNVNEAPPNALPYRDTPRYYEAFNSAVMVPVEGPVQLYHKSKLVPGIERMPFTWLLRPLGGLVERFGGIAGSLGTQKERSVFEGPEGPAVAPVICYESIYGDYMTEYVTKGAALIFVITNDGWWRNTPGYRQHNQYARLRAIETRRSIARAASTGISSFIDQKGDFLQKTAWWESTAIRQSINQNDQLTYYSVHGNFLGKISVFIALLLIMYLISQGIIKKDKQRKL